MLKSQLFRGPCLLALPIVMFLTLASSAAAGTGQIDLTLAGTYQFGGKFELEDFDFGFIDLKIEDSGGAAIFLGIPVIRDLQLELIAVRQETEVAIDEGGFAGDFVIGDADLNYYHLGGLWSFPIGQIEPYIAISAGLTRFSFDIPGVGDDSFASVSFGAGFKVRFSQHLGVRVDGRLFATDLDDDFYDRDSRCGRHCDEGDSMVQGFLSAGLLFSF